MDKVINFPENGNQKENEVNEVMLHNKNYLEGVRSKMGIEFAALVRTNNHKAIQLGTVISNIVESVVKAVDESLTSSGMIGEVNAQYFMTQCMQSVNAILAGGVISPITGDEEEWVDTTSPQDAGQEFKTTYRGKEFSIPIESVQVNKRYPKIYRLNNDNNLAHRIDYFQFHDAKNPNNVHLTEDSIRFIQFPYTMDALHSHCIVDENVISDYLDFDYTDVKDGLIYPNQASDDADSYVIAPKIPLSMLEEAGIIIESEIEEYLKYINASSEDDGAPFLPGDDFDDGYDDLCEE